MKLNEAIGTLDKVWIRKPKGYRIHIQKRVNNELTTDYIPGIQETPLDSDVTAWRFAWKLDQAQKKIDPDKIEEKMFNIFVVDDEGNPINHYATGYPVIYNAKDHA